MRTDSAPHDHHASTCASAASVSGSQNVISIARYISMAVDERGTGLLPLAGRGIQRAQAAVAVGLERAHAQFLGQGEGLAVVGCRPARPRGGSACAWQRRRGAEA